jgi:serine/threonine protein phosphatase 1
MNNLVYAIGDIHGELEMLQDAVAKVESDGGSDATVVFVGDYVDRGARSREVIDYLIDGLSTGKNWICLLGNHDRMFSLFLEESPRRDPRLRIEYTWLHERLGGRQTLLSYGVDIEASPSLIHQQARAAVPMAHQAFLQSLKHSHQIDNLLFVHAGIRPGVPIAEQLDDDLIWIRQEFLEDTRQHPFLIVHGHTPVPVPRHYGNRVAIDTGAGYGKPLTTAVFEGDRCWLLTADGRSLLEPEPLQAS